MHADAFQAGLIDASRLLEVVVEPAVKLARKLNQLGPEAATAPFAESSVYIPGVTPQLPDQVNTTANPKANPKPYSIFNRFPTKKKTHGFAA